ncbi:MAG: dihydroorotate dehydrogenase electron transfer subunit [Oscillospiraceae bacterium]|nr:dihydroorotate dehydrogenase electron transfer subunit [Oscillospiraceae bacterium]
MPDIYICKIVDKEKLNDTTYAITFIDAGLVSAARPGQFLHVKCGSELILRRPLGISSISRDALSFVFEKKGKGTDWLSKRNIGDILDILGPLGNGFHFPNGNIIVVGGGLGCAPLLFAAESAKSGVTAVLGFREMGRVILAKDFENVCNEVYLATEDGSLGIHGTVAAPLEALLKQGSYSAVMTCGQFVMQRAVADLCRQYATPCQVLLEERMGCGVGACLVCACATQKGNTKHMSRVCIDGPVFNSDEVIWE